MILSKALRSLAEFKPLCCTIWLLAIEDYDGILGLFTVTSFLVHQTLIADSSGLRGRVALSPQTVQSAGNELVSKLERRESLRSASVQCCCRVS